MISHWEENSPEEKMDKPLGEFHVRNFRLEKKNLKDHWAYDSAKKFRSLPKICHWKHVG